MAALPDLLTTQEVADWLRVSRTTVYKMVQAGELPYHRVGNAIRFDRATVVAAVVSAIPPTPPGHATRAEPDAEPPGSGKGAR